MLALTSDSDYIELLPSVTGLRKSVTVHFSLKAEGNTVSLNFWKNQENKNNVISIMCIYTTCEQIVTGVIALTPTYSIISYGNIVFDLRIFSFRLFIYAHFINTTRS
jgi:hypothetical protein